jgi:1-deoxy-D-xylulose-5-phosphate synthase
MYSLLDTIDSPTALRRLPLESLRSSPASCEHSCSLPSRRREVTFPRISAPVELTIALHYVFDTPRDRIVWDVGHQTYAHKILTGRRAEMNRLRMAAGRRAFPVVPRANTTRLAPRTRRRPFRRRSAWRSQRSATADDRSVIAVIGDGAMSAGMAFEALNNAGIAGADLLVILNDNEMSISEPVGALNGYLARLLASRFYNSCAGAARKCCRSSRR